jgi:hypothetical protein
VTGDLPNGHNARQDGTLSRRTWYAAGAGLTMVGVALLLLSALWQPSDAAAWQPIIHQAASQLWSLFLIAGLLTIAYERFLHHRLLHELVRLTGPRIVQALPPQQVMSNLLSAIYGDNPANRDVISAVLGGEGRQPDRTDLTVSSYTLVEVDLQAIDLATYQYTLTVNYSFKENVPSDRFVVIATCDPLLRDSLVVACRLPLFDTWFFPDSTLFHDSVDAMLPSVRIRIDYTDLQGHRTSVPWSHVPLKDVTIDKWPDYLTFFREPMASLPKQSVRDHLSTLRIFECNLSDIADSEIAVQSVERLSLRATSLQQRSDGVLFWQAPYPCYVERFNIDATRMQLDGEEPYCFRVVPFAVRSHATSATWARADSLQSLELRSWLLPGHGVALLWRPAGEISRRFA